MSGQEAVSWIATMARQAAETMDPAIPTAAVAWPVTTGVPLPTAIGRHVITAPPPQDHHATTTPVATTCHRAHTATATPLPDNTATAVLQAPRPAATTTARRVLPHAAIRRSAVHHPVPAVPSVAEVADAASVAAEAAVEEDKGMPSPAMGNAGTSNCIKILKKQDT